MGISALVLTYNEQDKIKQCLDGLSFADEIVVVDSFSTDSTVDIVKKYTDRVFQKKFEGFSSQWNMAIEQAREDWVFIVGADEVITQQLASQVLGAAESAEYDAYRMPRSTFFTGKRIRYCGWYPDYQLRLILREKANIPHRLVHETLVYDGPVGTLTSPIVHYSYDTVSDYCRKMVMYAKAAAEQKYKEGRSFHLADILLNPGHAFFKMYIANFGFMDGMHGLVLSGLTACSSLLRYAYLWELCRSKKEVSHEK